MPAYGNILITVAFSSSLWPFSAYKLCFSFTVAQQDFYCQLCAEAVSLLSTGGWCVLAVKGEPWGRALGQIHGAELWGDEQRLWGWLETCRMEGWSCRRSVHRTAGMLFDCTALSVPVSRDVCVP